MRILHVIAGVDPRNGGPIEGVKQLYRPLTELGHIVEIACSESPDSPALVNFSGPKVHALGPSIGKYGYCIKLKRWLNENVCHYDAVIVNGIWQYHSLAVWMVLRNTSIPYFVFTHGMLDPWFKRNYPLKHLKKCLYWPWGEYRVLRDASAVIFTCEDERILARESFSLYRVNEAVTSYGTAKPPLNGSELADAFISAHPDLKNKRLVLFLSRIHEKKGCDILIDAFARVSSKDSRLQLVVAGPDQTGWVPVLQEKAKSLGIADRVTWPGMLQGDMKWGAFYAAEVFVLPSHQENFGIVVAEALACGKPVLISNKVNIWREIETEGVGLVANDTLEGTQSLFERWLAMGGDESDAMKAKTRICFETRFHIDRAALRLLEIIKEYG